MAQRVTAIFADQIDDNAMGDGLKKNVSEDTIMQVAVKANDGLAFDTAELTVDYDDATLGIITNKLAVKDEGITEAKLDIDNAPSDGYYLKWTTANGLEWADVDADSVQEDDFIFHEIPTGDINSVNTDYTLANTPVAGTVQVFLNGMLQAPGSGLDYTISGTTISFTKAPHTGSDLYAHYIVS